MRVLKFIVDNTTIKPDPNCDFTGLFPGMNERVLAEFTFSPDWKSTVKVAAFWSILDKEYPPQVINTDGTCQIPTEALAKVAFKVQVLGKRISGATVQTNKLVVYQSGNKNNA